MNARLVHRGPDDEGIHVDPVHDVALAARRLSIIDVEGGHQPVPNEDRTIWAVLNGEIYNHPALQARLRERGHTLASRTDTEVLVHLYEEFGDEFVHALEGMFAFAIWDSREQRLLVGRDRFGEKPLFYAEEDGALLIASELTALRAGMAREPELDPDAVDAFFTFGYVSAPRTIVSGVETLLPGHLLTWDCARRRTSIRRYWTPPVFDATEMDHLDAVAEVERLLTGSIRTRMVADVPLGVFLSGGIDSALIAALAARESSRPVKTFTVDYDIGDVSEAEAARHVARAIGSDHREVQMGVADIAASVPDVLARLDQPIADQALVALHAVARAARDEITVAIGGEGADEIFGGYPRYRWLAISDAFGTLLPPGAGATGAALTRAARLPERLSDVLEPKTTISRHVDWVTSNRRGERDRLYGRAMGQVQIGQSAPETAVQDRVAWGAPVAGAFMGLDQRSWLPDDVLAKADRATMLTSLEMRTPFLHHELTELAATIPVQVHMRGGGKFILRKVLERAGIPISSKLSKRAFRVPVGAWLRDGLGATFEAQLATSATYSEGWFDRSAMESLLAAHRSGARDASAVLWPVFTFSCWLDAWRGS